MVACLNLAEDPIAEDTAHFGNRTFRNLDGTDLAASPRGQAVRVTEGAMQTAKGQCSSTALSSCKVCEPPQQLARQESLNDAKVACISWGPPKLSDWT